MGGGRSPEIMVSACNESLQGHSKRDEAALGIKAIQSARHQDARWRSNERGSCGPVARIQKSVTWSGVSCVSSESVCIMHKIDFVVGVTALERYATKTGTQERHGARGRERVGSVEGGTRRDPAGATRVPEPWILGTWRALDHGAGRATEDIKRPRGASLESGSPQRGSMRVQRDPSASLVHFADRDRVAGVHAASRPGKTMEEIPKAEHAGEDYPRRGAALHSSYMHAMPNPFMRRDGGWIRAHTELTSVRKGDTRRKWRRERGRGDTAIFAAANIYVDNADAVGSIVSRVRCALDERLHDGRDCAFTFICSEMARTPAKRRGETTYIAATSFLEKIRALQCEAIESGIDFRHDIAGRFPLRENVSALRAETCQYSRKESALARHSSSRLENTPDAKHIRFKDEGS
ncbi:hypothetical protein K438DRAFT_1746810 [Mycena galopus ATCC 62051]|nr:hypothetical protein K438DRAFT_1746810 [Mycena galopus ATCC 62051]